MWRRVIALIGGCLLLGNPGWGQAQGSVPAQSDTAAPVVAPASTVWGWCPVVQPPRFYRQYDFSLFSHLACYTPAATASGQPYRLPGALAPLVAAVHESNPQCRVLLSVHYQKTAQPALQAAAFVRQVATAHADGLNLEVALRQMPPRPLSALQNQQEQRFIWQAQRFIKENRSALNKASATLRRDTIWQHKQWKAARTPGQRQSQQQALLKLRARARVFSQQLIAYRQHRDTLAAVLRRRHLRAAPFTGLAGAIDVAALRTFAQQLRQQLTAYRPGTSLTLSLPAANPLPNSLSLASLVPAVDLFVLSVPGPSATARPLPPALAGRPAVAAAAVALGAYYRAYGLPTSRLLVNSISLNNATAAPITRASAVRPLRNSWNNWMHLEGLGDADFGALGATHASTGPTQAELPMAVKHTLAAPRVTRRTTRRLTAPPLATLPAWSHFTLFAAALLIGFGSLGGLLGALLQSSAIIPFRQRLLRVGALLGTSLSLLLLYSYLLGPNHLTLRYTCLTGLTILVVGLLYQRLRQPAILP